MLPASVKQTLWSYDTTKIDLQKHKKTIIEQVLNFGTKEATDWLFSTYKSTEITKIAETIPQTAWDKKSLSFWSFILNIHPPMKRLLP